MKHLLTLISMICSANCFAQSPSPDLFQTWYLYDYYSTDDNIHHPISGITPSISPYVTFFDTMIFDGMGACNSFSGIIDTPAEDVLSPNDFSSTLLSCGSPEHISFEEAFFSFMQSGGQFYLSGEGNNMHLIISNPIFINYAFRNSQLSTSSFDAKQVTVYPNPTDYKFFVNSQNNVIDKIEIFNSIGQTVKTLNNNFEVIDMSDFTSGVYSIKIYLEDKTVLKKITKK